MPVITPEQAPRFDAGGATITGLASPSRGSSDTAAWRVRFAPGQASPPHSLDREEVFVVLEGTADVLIGDERSQARPGDAIVVPPGLPFELQPATGSSLRAICVLPVGGRAVLGDGTSFPPPWSL